MKDSARYVPIECRFAVQRSDDHWFPIWNELRVRYTGVAVGTIGTSFIPGRLQACYNLRQLLATIVEELIKLYRAVRAGLLRSRQMKDSDAVRGKIV